MKRFRRLFVVALVLRAALALITEWKPLFPAYYYTDAVVMDQTAVDMVAAWRERREFSIGASPAQRAHAALTALVYLAAGHHPLAVKLLNAALGATACAAIAAAVDAAFGGGAGVAVGWLVALWPSAVFFHSQNFKDALALLLLWSAWACGAPLLGADEPPPRKPTARAVALPLLLALTGFFRSYLLVATAASFALSAALARGRRGALAAAGALLAIPLYLVLSRWAYAGPLKTPAHWAHDPTMATGFVVSTFDPGSNSYVKPLSPRGISSTRRLRQLADSSFAKDRDGREIGTQIFPGETFDTWPAMLAFIPRASFYVLFMPLPVLYPIAGKLGRLLASAENVPVLLLCLLAARSLAARRPTAAQAAFLAFFLIMSAGSALLEFDLGSAARHKIGYLPALFPFGLAWLLDRRKPREGRRKVFEVLECGGPGGTGNQAAALCNGVDHKRFDVTLVYNVRPGSDAEGYRALACGAGQALRLEEFVREISPLKDAAAFWKLYRLFRAERPDVVHAHSSKAGALARPAAWLAGVPLIYYTPHGYGFLQQDRGALSRALYRLAELSVSWIGTIVAVSESEAVFARRLSWGTPVEVVRDAFLGELPESAGPEAHEGLRVGSCGRLTFARHPEAFVHLSQRLTDSRNKLTCVWIGGGEDEARVRRDLENMNLASKVEVTGWLERAEAQKRLRGLDVLVHYSRWDGLPNAVLEGMAHGLPVVAADVPGARDAVLHGETGFLAKNEIELLEYTLKLVDDQALRRRLGDNGRRRVRDSFALDSALARWEDLYGG